MKFRVVVEKDENGYYVAEVPALPGCVSQGKTMAEAIAGWLEVMNEKTKRRQVRTIEVVI